MQANWITFSSIGSILSYSLLFRLKYINNSLCYGESSLIQASNNKKDMNTRATPKLISLKLYLVI